MISKIIKFMRVKKGLTQEEIAKLLNVAPSTISGYETNYSQPTFEMIERIADVCDFKIEFNNNDGTSVNSKNIDRMS